jgi:hypothetical protein
MSHRDQEIAEGAGLLASMRGVAGDRCFDQPALVGLPEVIFALFVRDKLA